MPKAGVPNLNSHPTPTYVLKLKLYLSTFSHLWTFPQLANKPATDEVVPEVVPETQTQAKAAGDEKAAGDGEDDADEIIEEGGAPDGLHAAEMKQEHAADEGEGGQAVEIKQEPASDEGEGGQEDSDGRAAEKLLYCRIVQPTLSAKHITAKCSLQ